MKILGLGIDYSTGEGLVQSKDEQEFASTVLTSLATKAKEMQGFTRSNALFPAFRGEMEAKRSLDLNDPRTAGWTFLIHENDPKREDIIRILRPLAEHRGMKDPSTPMLFGDEQPDQWLDWLISNYTSLDAEKAPYYILIVGGPDRVPFKFQSLLDSVAAAGRLDFDSTAELEAYVAKILRIENAADPVVERKTLFFATDGGMDDPTYFSRKYMAEPLRDYVQEKLKMPGAGLFGDAATKAGLVQALATSNPALVYTASHGMGAPRESLEVQKRINGAICCQRQSRAAMSDWLFSADDIPTDRPFLDGSVLFQFACYGAGTPAESDFMHWLGAPTLNGRADFVAAMPKAALRNPHGPIAVVAHVDTAWLHGFDDPESPHLIERWHARIDPFVRAVESLLSVEPVGHSLATMHKRYNAANAILTNTFDRLSSKKLTMTPALRARVAETFITRSDAQNYIVLGDPAARLRIPV